MASTKDASRIAAKLGLGVSAGIGIYLACVLVTVLLGGMYYSVTLGALVALAVSVVILAYRWMRRRSTTSWSLVGAMVGVQVVIAALAVRDSPSTALMWLR